MLAIIRLTLFLLLGLCLPTMAADLALPLKKMPNKTFADVQVEAQAESVTGPMWGNAPDRSTLPFHATLSGTVTADATLTKLAIFSDDGCDVYVDGTKVWSALDSGQALPKQDQSLHELPGTLSAGTHTVRIDYSNIAYRPADPGKGIPPDIDGCTLFQYGPKITINATSGLTGGKARACAGAIADSVHEVTLTLQAMQSGSAAPNLPLTLAFDASVDYTGCQAPQLIDDQNQNKPVSTLTRTTDANGNITVTVLSSDLISTPNLIVTYTGTQVGSVGCEFAADQSKRRYGILTYDSSEGNGTDTGWDFNPYSLIIPDDTADAIIFLKFQKDPNFQLPSNSSLSIDPNYYLVDSRAVPSLDVNNDGQVSDNEYNAGTIRGDSSHPLDDASNWLPVNGHTMHVRITQIVDLSSNATITNPTTIKNYVYYVNENGIPIDSTGTPVPNPNNFSMPQFVPVHTGIDGSAKLHLKAGPLVLNLGEVDFEEVDETQPAISGTGTF